MNCSRPILTVRGVSHYFNKWGVRTEALSDVTLEVLQGEWVNLIGANGSGKSTLLNIISGKIDFSAGEVVLAGLDIRGLSRREISEIVFYVQQDPTMGTAGALSIFEHLSLADSRRRKGKLAADFYRSLLEDFQLGAELKQSVYTLSGGQRQLLTLLIAYLRPAPILALDEPLAALDPLRAAFCSGALEELSRNGKTIIFVTHQPEVALSSGTRTVGLSSGRLIYDKSGKERRLEELEEIWHARREFLAGHPS